MLVCIGGFPGSGRNRLADAIARETGFRYEKISAIKSQPVFRIMHGSLRYEPGTPYSDDLLILVYKRFLEQMPVLSKAYPDMIIRDHFTREGPREYFFSEMERYFGKPLIVYAKATEAQCAARLRETVAKPRRLERRLRSLHVFVDTFQPFTRDVHEVRFMDDPQKAVHDVCDLIRMRR